MVSELDFKYIKTGAELTFLAHLHHYVLIKTLERNNNVKDFIGSSLTIFIQQGVCAQHSAGSSELKTDTPPPAKDSTVSGDGRTQRGTLYGKGEPRTGCGGALFGGDTEGYACSMAGGWRAGYREARDTGSEGSDVWAVGSERPEHSASKKMMASQVRELQRHVEN